MASSSLSSTMRAWQYSSTKGGIEKNLSINPSAPLPKPKSDQHLIRVIATALNPVDYKPAEFPGVARIAIPKPAAPGIDFVGSIVKPAPGSDFKAGQLVFGWAGTSILAGGALREFALARTNGIAALPDHVDPIDAATVAIAGLTAYQSIVPHVKKGDRIFINGGSGGTGVFGIQFAKAVGCHVTTTCSTPNVALCKSLGADRVVDYKRESVVDALVASGHKFDHAVDNVGTEKELLWRCHEFMKLKSTYVMVGIGMSLADVTDGLKRQLLPKFMGGIKANIVGIIGKAKPEDLAQIGEWMSKGQVKAVIDQKFSFEEAPQALEKLKTGRAKGKIVVEVASESYRKASP